MAKTFAFSRGQRECSRVLDSYSHRDSDSLCYSNRDSECDFDRDSDRDSDRDFDRYIEIPTEFPMEIPIEIPIGFWGEF